MSDRAKGLQATSEAQLDELVALVRGAAEAQLRRPCPGREKLGDGSVAAAIGHTASVYARIAAFVTGDHGAAEHGHPPTADRFDAAAVLESLADARARLARVARLSNAQLDAVPAAGSFRFADGQRSLAQVIEGLLRHQRHQLDALRAALE